MRDRGLGGLPDQFQSLNDKIVWHVSSNRTRVNSGCGSRLYDMITIWLRRKAKDGSSFVCRRSMMKLPAWFLRWRHNPTILVYTDGIKVHWQHLLLRFRWLYRRQRLTWRWIYTELWGGRRLHRESLLLVRKASLLFKSKGARRQITLWIWSWVR